MQKLQLHLSYHHPLKDVSWPISILQLFLCSEIGKKCYIKGYGNLPLIKKVTSSMLMGKRLTAQSGVTSEGTLTMWPVTEQNNLAQGTDFCKSFVGRGKENMVRSHPSFSSHILSNIEIEFMVINFMSHLQH
jgi:hypothetical protein